VRPVFGSGTYAIKEEEETADSGPNPKRRLNVLELGAGSGIAGFGAAFGGHHVWLTDKEVMTTRTSKNIEMNQEAVRRAGGSVRYACLDWHAPVGSWSAIPRELDLIVASDVVWATPFIEPFLGVLEKLLQLTPEAPPEILFAHKSRDPAVETAFFEEAERRGFVSVESLVSGGLEEDNEYFHPRVTLHKLAKKS